MKRLYILAGANGSGKSTISRVLLPTERIVYVNPDDIAKELKPSYYNGGTDIVLVAHGNGALNIILKERYMAFMEGLCRN